MKKGIILIVLLAGFQCIIAQNYVSKDPAYVDNVEKAATAYEEKDYKTCATCYEKALAVTTKSYYSVMNAARCYSLAGDQKNAARWVEVGLNENYEAVSSRLKQDEDFAPLKAHKKCWKKLEKKQETARIAYESTINVPLRDELALMFENDQKYRKQMRDVEKEFGWESDEMKELWNKQGEVDSLNMLRLEEIIAVHGYPGKDLVGANTARAGFFIIQHADLKYQEKYLPLLKKAADNGDIRKSTLALLIDRVRMRNGETQLYGTQIKKNEEGEYYVHDIEDPENIDKLRAEVGLGPLAEYVKRWDITWPPKKNPIKEVANPFTKEYQRLTGQWKLTAIKYFPQDEIVMPKKDYWVEFSQDKINYKLEVNTCFMGYKITGLGELKTGQAGCTKMCCDKDISEKLRYSAVQTYEFKGDRLILSTDKEHFEFSRK